MRMTERLDNTDGSLQLDALQIRQLTKLSGARSESIIIELSTVNRY